MRSTRSLDEPPNSTSTTSSPCEAATRCAAARISSSLTDIVSKRRKSCGLPPPDSRRPGPGTQGQKSFLLRRFFREEFAPNKKWALSPLISPPAVFPFSLHTGVIHVHGTSDGQTRSLF